jgi:hypothetical protein
MLVLRLPKESARVRELLYLVGPMPTDDGRTRWFERDDGDARLKRDRELIRHHYPDLKYGLNHRSKQVFLDGTITLRAECGIRTHIKTRITFGDSYPRYEPIAYETGNMFPHIADRHFFPDGACCLWLPVESQWNTRAVNALHEFLDQVSTFFERQLILDASPDKRWAWGQRGHGIEGYIEFIQEALAGDASLISNLAGLLSGREQIAQNSDCPCKGGKKYKSCHAKGVARLIEQLGVHNPFLRPREDQVSP